MDRHYMDYISHYKLIIHFLEKKFGKGNYLVMKNSGLIADRDYGIKGEKITGYAFHGSGCGFQFKNIEVDIEFSGEKIGFTNWSFYSFLKRKNAEINEDESKKYLLQKVENGDLFIFKKLFFPAVCKL